jgi:hypothetical protein
MNRLANADIIKAQFIDYVLENKIFPIHEDFCIGQEVMYGINKYFADLVIISEGKLFAFEIKAHNDNFRRLNKQIENYIKIFDFVYVIATKNHSDSLKKITQKSIGYFIIDDDNIQKIKSAKFNKKKSKVDILETIPAAELKKLFSIKKKMSADQIRTYLLNRSSDSLRNALLKYLQDKIQYKYRNFLNERGESSHFEDIAILSLIDYSILK